MILQVESTDSVQQTWRKKAQAPVPFSSFEGAAVVHGNTAYFSQDYNVYSYTITKDTWASLKRSRCAHFGMAVVNNRLTTIGGEHSDAISIHLFCLSGNSNWKQLLPSMPTARTKPVAVTTPNHLIVAGGIGESILSTVEVLNINTYQWFSANSLPETFSFPHMTLCDGYVYLSQNKIIFFMLGGRASQVS